MVSYYNSANLPYATAQSWFSSNYPHNHQYLGDVDSTHPQHVYYNPSYMFHQSPSEWSSHENFRNQQNLTQQSGGPGNHNNINQNTSHGEHSTDELPSPPITVSGSEISSPGAPNGTSSPHTITNMIGRPTPARSPYYDWMKKPSYPSQPNPGKTRTKDKYRVVYTDFQRLELEKEYHTSKYITIRRKTELAQTLALSERQVKIWFQNRRAKERKQNKKREDTLVNTSSHISPGILNMTDTKPKIEPGLHFQHPLHQMSSMAMSMSQMGLHHSVLHHSHLSVPPPQSQHLT